MSFVTPISGSFTTRTSISRRLLRPLITAALALLVAAPAPALAGGCAADFSGDNTVDGADLGVLLAGWGGPAADLDGNGITDGADLGALLAAWGDCPAPECDGFVSMDFAGNAISLGEAGFPSVTVVLDGSIGILPMGAPAGVMTATFSDGSKATITMAPFSTVITSGGSTLDLLAPTLSPIVTLDGTPMPGFGLIDLFVADASSGMPPGAWAPSSRALAALAALTSTPEWKCNVETAEILEDGGGVAGQGFWCKTAAYGAATIIAGLAAGGCFALTAGCAAGSVVTIGGLAVPCTVLVGLCGAAGFAGTAAAYEAVLALWG